MTTLFHKTWWGHQYIMGRICSPGWNWVKVATETWWGPVPMSPCKQARLEEEATTLFYKSVIESPSEFSHGIA